MPCGGGSLIYVVVFLFARVDGIPSRKNDHLRRRAQSKAIIRSLTQLAEIMRRSAESRKDFRKKLKDIRARFKANPIVYRGPLPERTAAPRVVQRSKPLAVRDKPKNRTGSAVDIQRPSFLQHYLDLRGRLRPHSIGVKRKNSEGTSVIPRDVPSGGGKHMVAFQ